MTDRRVDQVSAAVVFFAAGYLAVRIIQGLISMGGTL